jgi:hypothetical protein
MYGQSNLRILGGNSAEQQLGQDFDWRRMAASRFWRLYAGGIGRRLRRLFGRSQEGLQSLSEATKGLAFEGAHQMGTATVPLARIQGSEGKSNEFDREFRPLKAYIRERWVSLAAAYLRGVVLPPVELIKVNENYYVRDGHHRISVARAFGQVDIDAEVIVCNLAGAK